MHVQIKHFNADNKVLETLLSTNPVTIDLLLPTPNGKDNYLCLQRAECHFAGYKKHDLISLYYVEGETGIVSGTEYFSTEQIDTSAMAGSRRFTFEDPANQTTGISDSLDDILESE